MYGINSSSRNIWRGGWYGIESWRIAGQISENGL
jgi:hypothetical protein